MKSQNKKAVAYQIVNPLCIFLVLLTAALTVLMLIYTVSESLEERSVKGRQISQYTTNRITDYAAADWLTEYWLANYDEMEFIYTETAAAELRRNIALDIPGYSGIKNVTSEQAAALSPEIQKKFAEYCYAAISADLNWVKREFGPTYLDMFVIRGNECIFLVSGCGWDETHISEGGSIFELGVTIPFELGDYPVLDKILSGELPEDTMDVSLSQGADHSNVRIFDPVYDDSGELVMIVSVSQQWDDIMSEAIAVTAASGLAVSVLFILIVIRTVRLISKYVVRPIKMEEAVLAEYVRDKDPEKVITSLSEVKCRNEIETLAENFSYMAAEIDTHIKTVRAVTAEKERIGAELDMAAKIQASQLPSTFPAFPDRTEFDIYASMDPAKEVGGDFYDFFLIDDDHLAVVIADVSGKGVPAALFMMSSKMLINSFALSGGRPSEILGAVNNMLCERSADDMFVTVWLGILELSTGKLTSTNAGHENPAIKKAGGSFEILKDRHSPVVAAMPDIPYREQVMQLEPGDTLFVYTDGVPEATSAQVELFGEERLSKALNSVGDVPLEKLLDTVNSAVSDFVGDAPQFDDLTMLALRYNGK